MKAIGYRTKGGVEVLTDIELPRPTPGPRDLLVAVKAVSMNPVDTKRRQRESPETAPGHRVLGYDASGTVEAFGRKVSLFKPGDEVFYARAMDRPGTNAEFHSLTNALSAQSPRRYRSAKPRRYRSLRSLLGKCSSIA